MLLMSMCGGCLVFLHMCAWWGCMWGALPTQTCGFIVTACYKPWPPVTLYCCLLSLLLSLQVF